MKIKNQIYYAFRVDSLKNLHLLINFYTSLGYHYPPQLIRDCNYVYYIQQDIPYICAVTKTHVYNCIGVYYKNLRFFTPDLQTGFEYLPVSLKLMLMEEQLYSKNKPDLNVFRRCPEASSKNGGFDWENSKYKFKEWNYGDLLLESSEELFNVACTEAYSILYSNGRLSLIQEGITYNNSHSNSLVSTNASLNYLKAEPNTLVITNKQSSDNNLSMLTNNLNKEENENQLQNKRTLRRDEDATKGSRVCYPKNKITIRCGHIDYRRGVRY